MVYLLVIFLEKLKKKEEDQKNLLLNLHTLLKNF